ncbi:MAG: phosphoenolpyruvate kinase [Deltaproteobacteria bacterium]|nr:phosphoenolpyruvate kinase [Deltaproteobacteria bacterium]
MTTTTHDIMARLQAANHAFAARFPGDSPRRQPVHTVYGGAHLFKADTAKKMAGIALKHMDEHAPDAATLQAALGLTLSPEQAATLHARVREKLGREAIEDFRIDFEDGYGNRPDAEEDAQAQIAAREVAAGMAAGSLPPFIGIRIKPLTEELARRSLATLELFLSTLAPLTGGRVPDGFVITLPKVTHAAQVTALADLLDHFEATLGYAAGSLKAELMIETTQAIVGADGRVTIPALLDAGRGRVVSCHFGTYDYTASCNITAAYQGMQHPACDFATHLMQVALGQTGVWMSDGATTIMPVPPHRAKAGEALTAEQQRENRDAVHRAWRVAFDNVEHSLVRGIYQGWDLHPGQLVARYAAVYDFFLRSLQAASVRLENFMRVAATATLSGDVFDDAATGQGLINYFLRAINCGAITEEEVVKTGLTLDEIRTRSFVKILAGRRARAAAGGAA